MSRPSFQDYLSEYESEGIGPLLYGLILEIVHRLSRHYPPQIYSPNQQWDEDAIVALAHDFVVEKLIKHGWLEHHLLAQETVSGLVHALKRDYRHFLISQRQRTEYLNLYQRVKQILLSDVRFAAYFEHENTATSQWGLASWSGTNRDLLAQNVDEVVDAMFKVELPRLIRYRADSKKLSHLLNHEDLSHLIESTFAITNKYIHMDLLMEALRYRLGLLESIPVSFEEPINKNHENGELTYASIIPSSVNIEVGLTNREAAEDIFDQLTDRQRHVFALYSTLQTPTLQAIGEVIGVSKSTVQNDLKAAIDHVSFMTDDRDEAETIFSFLSEMCGRYMVEISGHDEPN